MQDVAERLKAALAERYSVERELGAGGMATVYLAEDVKHHRKVALKVLRPELAAVLGPERFLREIEIAANLQHPHILPLYDSGEADGFLYYVMPYVDGESLRDRLNREKQLAIDESLEITKTVASALDYAHRHDVIHRDIKPENILLQDGEAVVADFGIALAVKAAGGTRLTETGISLGTPHYMSPEQATADRELTRASDVYSLACVTYEMLAGEPPHTGPTAQAIIGKILSHEPARITAHRETVPAHVDEVLSRALARLPADRFDSAPRFAGALMREEVAVTAPRVDQVPVKPITVPPSRPWRPWAYVVVGLFALAAGAWVWNRFVVGTDNAAISSLAVLPLDNQTGDPGQEYLVDGMTDALIQKLSQVEALRVISRTSSMTYKDSSKTIPEIARDLNVDALIDGSVFRQGDQVRVSVQLVRADPEEPLWSDAFDRDLGDVMALHSEVALVVAREIEITLTPGDRRRLATPPPVDREARDAFLRGEYHLARGQDQGDWTEFEAAVASFEEALAIDSNFADARAGLGSTLGWMGSFGGETANELNEKSRVQILKAISIDEASVQAWRSLGFQRFRVDWDLEGAEEAYERARQLDPSKGPDATYLWMVGRLEEAIDAYNLLIDEDPVSLLWKMQLGAVHSCGGQREDARQLLEGVRELDSPLRPRAYGHLANEHRRAGEFELAVESSEMYVRLTDSSARAMRELAESYALAGRGSDALDVLLRFGDPDRAPHVHLALGDADRALDQLEQAYDEHDSQAFRGCWWLGYEELWEDPRFQRVLRGRTFLR